MLNELQMNTKKSENINSLDQLEKMASQQGPVVQPLVLILHHWAPLRWRGQEECLRLLKLQYLLMTQYLQRLDLNISSVSEESGGKLLFI